MAKHKLFVSKAQIARERARGRKIKGKFLFEGEPTSMADFFADNAEMPISAADARAIKALKPGQKLLLGGGAAATMEMERLGSLTTDKSRCPICNERVKGSMQKHLDNDHEHEVRQRRKNPNDASIIEMKRRGLNGFGWSR